MLAIELVPGEGDVGVHEAVQNTLASRAVDVWVLTSKNHEQLRAVLSKLRHPLERVALHPAEQQRSEISCITVSM